jgi:hypothetical protein
MAVGAADLTIRAKVITRPGNAWRKTFAQCYFIRRTSVGQWSGLLHDRQGWDPEHAWLDSSTFPLDKGKEGSSALRYVYYRMFVALDRDLRTGIATLASGTAR